MQPRPHARLRLAAIIATVMALGASVLAAGDADAQPRDDFDDAVVGLINDWRASLGLNRLVEHEPLSEGSMSWSLYMASGSAECASTGSRWGHATLSLADGSNPPGTRMLAENIGYACGPIGFPIAIEWSTAAGPLPSYCTARMDYTAPEVMVCGWLSNPRHRTTIERAEHTHIGFGTATRATTSGSTERYSTHRFATAPSSLPPIDPNCDGQLTIADALVIAQYESHLRGDVATCALTDLGTQLHATKGDFDGNGVTNIADALRIARCIVRAGPCPIG